MRNALLILLLFATLSCAPTARIFEIEQSLPSNSSLEMAGSSMTLFFSLGNGELSDSLISVNDSLFMANVANAFATKIEEELNLQEGALFIFSHHPTQRVYDADYIRELSFLSNSDIIFILDSLTLSNPTLEHSLPDGSNLEGLFAKSEVSSKLLAFNSFTGEQVASINKSESAYRDLLSSKDLSKQALIAGAIATIPNLSEYVGSSLAQEFFPKWQRVQRILYLLPGSKWSRAFEYAVECNWNEAMEIWLELTQENNVARVAVAAFNLAVACELTENLPLAQKWLEFSNKCYPLAGYQQYKQHLKERVETKK